MAKKEVMMDRMTRREFREGIARGDFQSAIIPTGACEQHLEHLTTGHDIRHSSHIAREAAMNLHPQVAVTVPMNLGISEHHMVHKGTITAKPGSWLAVLFDAVESVIRHGVKNVLILNGHGGSSISSCRRRAPTFTLFLIGISFQRRSPISISRQSGVLDTHRSLRPLRRSRCSRIVFAQMRCRIRRIGNRSRRRQRRGRRWWTRRSGR